jgi:hypothetical protein
MRKTVDHLKQAIKMENEHDLAGNDAYRLIWKLMENTDSI